MLPNYRDHCITVRGRIEALVCAWIDFGVCRGFIVANRRGDDAGADQAGSPQYVLLAHPEELRHEVCAFVQQRLNPDAYDRAVAAAFQEIRHALHAAGLEYQCLEAMVSPPPAAGLGRQKRAADPHPAAPGDAKRPHHRLA